MSNFGFGFGPGSGGPDDLSGKIPLFAELQRLLSGSGGPVNWDLARQLAISNLAAGHSAVSPADASTVVEAVRLADLWLDEVTDLPSGVANIEAWNRVDWVEKTIGSWAKVCDPVAGRVVSAMTAALPHEVTEAAGPMAPMMAQFGGLMFGAQLGQGLAALAGEVISATDIGLPLGPARTAALVVDNLDAFANDLERPSAEARLFVAVREAAHHRLYQHVPWLSQQLIDAVDAYGRGITIDPDAISSAISEIDPNNPASIQNALAGGIFEPKNSDAQNAALRRLETLLALVEGWVDAVTTAATGERMPASAALAEAIRRRRASGGPAEQTFATLVGLELRPRRLREAATLWAEMTARHGSAARDGLWSHPDLLPSADELDDPAGFVSRYGSVQELDMSGFEQLAAPAQKPTDSVAADQNNTSGETDRESGPGATEAAGAPAGDGSGDTRASAAERATDEDPSASLSESADAPEPEEGSHDESAGS
jgi:putative hydrolase